MPARCCRERRWNRRGWMFGHASLPCRVYSYGARPPATSAEAVSEQMRLAHKYRNRLVEAELDRRKKVDALLAEISPELVCVEADIRKGEVGLEEALEAIRKASQEARKKVRPSALVLRVKELRKALKGAYQKRKDLRTALFADPVFKARQEALDLEHQGLRKELRAASGLYWGTYLLVEQSSSGIRSGAPPKFARWDGWGHLAVQIQGGLSAAEVLGGQDTRLRIGKVPAEAWERGGRRLRRTTVSFRVGSDASGGPVWAEIPIVLHRPLPEDARIKWAHLIRERIATHERWKVQFVLERERWDKEDLATDGRVGIDVGWRIKEDGSLRVAVWKGSDGQEGELALDARWLGGVKKVRDLQSIRSKNLDAMKDAFGPLAKALAWPEALKERIQGHGLWKSPARFAAFAIAWRAARFEGDVAAFELLEAWRKQDKHLYEYERNLLDRLLARRLDLYRVFAAKLRRMYKTAVIEKLDLRDFHELPAGEADPHAAEKALKEHVRDAGLSFLIAQIKAGMAETIEADPKDTTRRCASCGHVQDFDQAKIEHTCVACGVTWDQDMNAATNLLRMAGQEGVKV